MSVNISAPQIALPSVGLRASIGSGVTYSGVERMPLPATDRWYTPAGWDFETAPCDTLKGGTICVNERPFTPGNPQLVEGVALTVESQISCTTLGTDIVASNGDVNMPKFEQYVLDQFDRQLFASISSELWSGTLSRAGNLTKNKFLTNNEAPGFTDLAPGAVVPLKDGLAMLDQHLACCNPSGNGLIHVPAKLLTYAGGQELVLDRESSRRSTWGGNDVVAECGYAGTGPGTFAGGPAALDPLEPGQMWLYATGPLLVRAAVNSSTLSHIDIENNNVYTTLSGAFMFGWGCCHAGIKVEACPS